MIVDLSLLMNVAALLVPEIMVTMQIGKQDHIFRMILVPFVLVLHLLTVLDQ